MLGVYCSKIVSASSVLRLRLEMAAAFEDDGAAFFVAGTVAFDVLDLVVRVGLSSVSSAVRFFASLVLARGLIGIDFLLLRFWRWGIFHFGLDLIILV